MSKVAPHGEAEDACDGASSPPSSGLGGPRDPDDRVRSQPWDPTGSTSWWGALAARPLGYQAELDQAAQSWFDKENKKSKERLLDKVTFVTTVVGSIISAICVGNPLLRAFIPYLYCSTMPLLFVIRYFQYKARKWHYFLLDFCYFANVALALYMLLAPSNGTTFIIVFALVHGPLPWSVIFFRNSVVFHSIDKFTSFYIHMMPCLVAFSIRWFPLDCSRWWVGEFYSGDNLAVQRWFPDANSHLVLGIGMPLVVLVCFIVQHSIENFVTLWVAYQPCCKSVLKVHNDDYLTLYRYAMDGGPGFFIIDMFGSRHHIKMWLLGNSFFSFVTGLPTYLWYYNLTANASFAFVVMCVGVWNGGNFYIEVFANRYSAARSKHAEPVITITQREHDALKASVRELELLRATLPNSFEAHSAVAKIAKSAENEGQSAS